MRERSQTTPRRRRTGPKQPLPQRRSSHFAAEERCEGVGASESPYYTIDNTEDIYGTTLLPSQRCYVDPWDLENYDYVRKKVAVDVVAEQLPQPLDQDDEYLYGSSLTPSPTAQGPVYGYGLSATMPRPHTRRISRSQCQMECCAPLMRAAHKQQQQQQQQQLYAVRSELYGMPPAHANRYDDYMATMTRQLHLDDDLAEEELLYGEQQQLYNGYGGFSSASSTEQQHSSSIGEDQLPPPRRAATLQRPRRSMPNSNNNNYGNYGTAPHPRRKRSQARHGGGSKPASPQIDFPAPPPLSPAYDYCNPYSTLPYCSLPDCYECQQQATSLIYAAPSTLYGTLGGGGLRAGGPPGQCSSSHSGDSSLYSGIYSRKFGLSKKGLLQIDYSCSWNDLDRVMGRHF